MTAKKNGNFSSSDRKAAVKRGWVYSVLAVVTAAFQCSFFARILPLGAVPDLILGLTVAVCLLDTTSAALVFSVGAGFVIDSVGGTGVSLTPVFLLILVLLLSGLSKKFMPGFFSYLILHAPAILAGALFSAARIFLSSSSVQISALFLKIVLPGFLSTLLFSVPLYFPVKFCISFINSKSKFKLK